MGWVTIYLPDDVERVLHAAARKAGKSFSAYITELATRRKKPRKAWPKSFLDTFGSWEGELDLKRLEALFSALTSVPFGDRAAEQYGVLRAQLEASGALIGPNDMLIAATALTEDAVVVTRNVREFSRVAGLRVENW